MIPVINENDTVVNDEIKFGDNDTLGALVTNLVDADALVILTDQKRPLRQPILARTRWLDLRAIKPRAGDPDARARWREASVQASAGAA